MMRTSMVGSEATFWDNCCYYLPRRLFSTSLSLRRGARAASLSVCLSFSYIFSNDTQLISSLCRPLHSKIARIKTSVLSELLLRARSLRDRHATPNATVRLSKRILQAAPALTSSRGTPVALSHSAACANTETLYRNSHVESAQSANTDSRAP